MDLYLNEKSDDNNRSFIELGKTGSGANKDLYGSVEQMSQMSE